MATLYIRSLPDSLYRRLARLAQEDRRSLSAEAVVLLEREMSKPRRSQTQVLAALDRFRLRPAGQRVPSSLELLKADRRR
ncbi:MAG: hypothetical protein HYZ90_03675 [Candidatus Omnitrophica bacterium]|nr:hypothetical protein [Candidatus Omnitrophota bacterium]